MPFALNIKEFHEMNVQVDIFEEVDVDEYGDLTCQVPDITITNHCTKSHVMTYDRDDNNICTI